MYRFFGFVKYAAIFVAVMLMGVVVAQTNPVTIFDPRTWFQNQDTLLVAVGLISPWITKALTSLIKGTWGTEGAVTQWVSLGVAFIVAGVGGFLGLGYFAGATGITAAIQAGALTAFAFLMSNGMAKNERQVAAATATKLYELEQSRKAE